MSDALEDLLTPGFAELAARVERDLSDHVAEQNERERNLLTVRGFGITSVSALLAATVASGQGLLAVVALLVVGALLVADLQANRTIRAIERRVPHLRSLADDIRKVLSGRTRRDGITDLQAQLRAYADTPPGTDALGWAVVFRVPVSRKPRRLRSLRVRHTNRTITRRQALGGFGVALYLALTCGCITIGVAAVGNDTRIQAVAACPVPPGADLRAAVDDGRCSPAPAAASQGHAACRVPKALTGSELVVRCTALRGFVLITVLHAGRLVAANTSSVSANGEAHISIGRHRRTWNYRVTVTRAGDVLAYLQPLKTS